MDWWLAVLVMYLGMISAWIAVFGGLLILVVGVYWVIFLVNWDTEYWSTNDRGRARKETRPKLMIPAIKKTKLLVPLAILMFLISSFVPSPQTLFKIVALKYGADAVTSDEAKNLGNKAYEAMDKSLSVLNSKLDEWNKKSK